MYTRMCQSDGAERHVCGTYAAPALLPKAARNFSRHRQQEPERELTRNMEYTPATHTVSRMTAIVVVVNRRGDFNTSKLEHIPTPYPGPDKSSLQL